MPSTKRSSSKTTNRSKSVGGRAASGGTRNETKYAATLAVQLLAGESMLDWRDASQIRSLTMQAGGDVDDVVIEACDGAKMLVQAKGWISKVSLTAKKGVLPDVFGDFAAFFASAPVGDHRLLWVVAPEMGDGITSNLRKALDLHRRYPAELPVVTFEKNRLKAEKAGWDAARRFAAEVLKQHLKRNASEDEARRFLRSVHVVVFDRSRNESDAVESLRDKVLKVPSQAMAAWRFLSDEFLDINSDGLSHTLQSLRATLERGRFELKPLERFAKDIESLRRISDGQLSELERHSRLPTDAGLRLERNDELDALRHASGEGSLVVVGAPGCGKSGLLHALALRLQSEGVPFITLLAENVRLGPGMESSAILGLEHGIDEVLCQWPSGSSGVFITDALDALRDDDLGRRMRQLLREVLKGNSGWRVVASVREFDLKAGTELQELFPGSGVSGYTSPEFSKVKHFHLGGLRDDDLQVLLANVPGIKPFVEAVRASPQGHGMDRSLFHLRIAAELLGAGVRPKRLADLTTPNLLFDRYWERMIERPKKGAIAREIMVRRICQVMVEDSRPVAMRNAVVTSDQDVVTVAELSSAGIVSAPESPSSLTSVGGVRFCHHLFQDYAIARTILPVNAEELAIILEQYPLLPLFYRQSFVLSLERLWESDRTREAYWGAALEMQSHPSLHGISRIVAPLLAAKQSEALSDLAPLIHRAFRVGAERDALKGVLMHLCSGLADVDDSQVKNVTDTWAEFASQLASAITQNPDVEAPLVHILARLNPIPASHEAKGWRNKAAIALLTLHLARPVNQGWTYAAMVSIECVCRTFAANPNESASMLLELMSDERLRLTPKDDLHRIANNLKHILPGGGQVILRAFEAAFGHEVKHGEWENLGGAIMPLRMQSSDQWHSVQYSLAQFFEGSLHDFPGLAAAILAILAWSDSDGTKSHSRRTELHRAIGQLDIMGHSITAIEDSSYYWQNDRRHAGNDIAGMMRSFRGSLVTWAATGNDAALQAVAAKLCSERQPAYLTSNLFKAGAAAPATLGIRLLSALRSPCVFVHVDLYFEATNLLVALHGLDREDVRREVEDLILRLSDKGLTELAGTEGSRKIKGYLKSAENRILGSLDAAKITHPKLKRLHAKREAEQALYRNSPPFSVEFREAKPTAPPRPKTRQAQELHDLKEFCQELSGKAKEKAFAALVSTSWKRVVRGWSFLERHAPKKSSMAYEAWGALVGLCENIAGQVHQWQANDDRWKLVEEVLIAAAAEPLGDRRTEDNPNADLPSYGVPFPQVDAAQGLPWLAKRLGQVNADVRKALLKLSNSSNYPIRFNLMSSLQAIAEADGNLMWQILNDRLAKESVFHVIEASATVIELGLYRGETRAWIALVAAEKRAESSKEDHSIRKRFAGIRLNYFVNQDHADCWSTISSLIQRCDEQASSSTLCGLIGWYREMLSVGEIGDLKNDQRRKRVWRFIHQATLVATQKLAALRKSLDENYAAGQQVSDGDQERLGSLTHVIDQVASQIYFGSGAYAHSHPNNGKPEDRLDVPKTRRFLSDATPTLKLLCKEPHPHVAYEVVQSLDHFLSADPIPVFEMAASSILASCKAGFQHESLAVLVVVRLIERALADHREIFRLRQKTMPETLKLLIRVLDLFVEAGSKEARRLTHRLEQIQT